MQCTGEIEKLESFRVVVEQEQRIMKLVCVTGAAGFIASWAVKQLLERGYSVRGTVRDPQDELKVAHLKSLEGASERLTLVRADLLDYQSLLCAIQDCNVVLHTACPCPEASTGKIADPDVQLIAPSVDGTLNVLRAAEAAGSVETIVMTSSVGAMYLSSNRSKLLDESCWSDEEYLRSKGEWYCLSKTLAEKAAWEFAREQQQSPKFKLVSINPSVVMGPLLQSKLNASSTHILKYLTGSVKTYANACQSYVDVRDVAEAHILAFEKSDASGRYFLAESALHRGDIVQELAQLFPQYPLPRVCADNGKPRAVPYQFSNIRARHLGVKFISLKQCLRASVLSLQSKNFLPVLQ